MRWRSTRQRSRQCPKILMVRLTLPTVQSRMYLARRHTAARESHKAQKVLQEQRKAAKPHSELLVDAKRAWTAARQKNLKKAERIKHIDELMEIIRGTVKDIVFKHDASRIVQTAVKYGDQKARNEIAEELKGKYRELAQSKYSKVRIYKHFLYGTDTDNLFLCSS